VRGAAWRRFATSRRPDAGRVDAQQSAGALEVVHGRPIHDHRPPGFAWRASIDPFGGIRITDALDDAERLPDQGGVPQDGVRQREEAAYWQSSMLTWTVCTGP